MYHVSLSFNEADLEFLIFIIINLNKIHDEELSTKGNLSRKSLGNFFLRQGTIHKLVLRVLLTETQVYNGSLNSLLPTCNCYLRRFYNYIVKLTSRFTVTSLMKRVFT